LSEEKDKFKKGWDISGVFIPAGLLIGMGIGWALDHLVPGLLTGLGVGFLLMAVAQLIYTRK
jgi:F0F1-type ATP synthase assembly protein I